MSDFDEDKILRTFDKLVDLGIIHYGDSTVIPDVSEGFPVSPSQTPPSSSPNSQSCHN